MKVNAVNVNSGQTLIAQGTSVRPDTYQTSGSSPPAIEVTLKLLAFMQRQTQAITEKQIQAEVPGRRAVKLAALRLLVAGGSIIREGTGKHGSPFRYKVRPQRHISSARKDQVPGTQAPSTPIQSNDPNDDSDRLRSAGIESDPQLEFDLNLQFGAGLSKTRVK